MHCYFIDPSKFQFIEHGSLYVADMYSLLPLFSNQLRNSTKKKDLKRATIHYKYLQYSIDLHILWYMECHGARNFIAIFFFHRYFTTLPFRFIYTRENTFSNRLSNKAHITSGGDQFQFKVYAFDWADLRTSLPNHISDILYWNR